MSTVLRKLRRFVGFTKEQSDSIAALESNVAKAVYELDASKSPRWNYLEVYGETVIAAPWDLLVLMTNGASVVLPTPVPELYGCQVCVVVSGVLVGSTMRAADSTINGSATPIALIYGAGVGYAICTRRGWFSNA